MSHSGFKNINDVEEVTVVLNTGQKIVYRGKGLEKLRRQMILSPGYGEGEEVRQTVVESFSDDDSPSPVPVKKTSKVSGPKIGPNGYHQPDLNYTPSTGKSAVDMAKEMQRQAEKSAGFKF